jgi:biopolymer transport protein ExbB
MNRVHFLLIAALAYCMAAALPAMAEEWPQVAREVAARADTAEARAGEAGKAVLRERGEVKRELAALKADVAAKQTRFKALREQYDQLLDREKALNEELKTRAMELKTMDGTIRSSAKQARDGFHESLTAPEFPERAEILKSILRPDRFPGLAGIRQLLDLYLGEMRASGRTVRRTGTYVAEDGGETTGEIVRIGAFTAAYRGGNGDMGFLRPEADGSGLVAVPGDPGWTLSGLMEDYFDGKGEVFPVDISSGAALQRLSQQQMSVGEWLSAGGLLVWPILLVGLAALVLVAERFVTLSRIRANSDRHMGRILKLVSERRWPECAEYCAGQERFPTCRIIGHTLQYRKASREIIENAFQEGLLKELPLLERFLPTLGVLAAVAPLLGLLGTVTGMINTFQIITLYGTGDPRMMSGGISEALVTTQLGLAVAVPIMILHHVLDRRVDKIVGDMEEKGAGFTVALMRQDEAETVPVSDGAQVRFERTDAARAFSEVGHDPA